MAGDDAVRLTGIVSPDLYGDQAPSRAGQHEAHRTWSLYPMTPTRFGKGDANRQQTSLSPSSFNDSTHAGKLDNQSVLKIRAD